MKNRTQLILIYTMIVIAMVTAVKLTQVYLDYEEPVHGAFIADCGDPPPTPGGGE